MLQLPVIVPCIVYKCRRSNACNGFKCCCKFTVGGKAAFLREVGNFIIEVLRIVLQLFDYIVYS